MPDSGERVRIERVAVGCERVGFARNFGFDRVSESVVVSVAFAAVLGAVLA